MPRIAYEYWEPKGEHATRIVQARQICEEYQAQGYVLTLRQLYYAFVSRALIPNNMRSYKNLGNLINKGRLAGLIDWNHVEDRTRNLSAMAHWEDPADEIQDWLEEE
jgi:hypothetical protein